MQHIGPEIEAVGHWPSANRVGTSPLWSYKARKMKNDDQSVVKVIEKGKRI